MSRIVLLNTYLAEVREVRFRPGVHDCAMFAAGWVERLTGRDLAGPWRGRYLSLDEGAQMLREHGYADHIAILAERFEEIPPAMARTGDFAVIDGKALGIFSSDRVFVLHPDGLAHVSRMRAKRAFRV